MMWPSSRWKWSGERVPPIDEVAGEAVAGLGLRRGERRVIGARDRLVQQRGEVVADRARQHEVAVGESLHQRRRAEAVGAVVGEVRLAGAVQAGDRGHQLVVDPEPAHRVVRCRVDPHRHLGRVLAGDALVHLEQVPVALVDACARRGGRWRRRSRGTRRSSTARRRGRGRRRAWRRARRCPVGRGCRSSGRAARGSSRGRPRGRGRPAGSRRRRAAPTPARRCAATPTSA